MLRADFAEYMREKVEEFNTEWARKEITLPEKFPAELPGNEEWLEQFLTFLEQGEL